MGVFIHLAKGSLFLSYSKRDKNTNVYETLSDDYSSKLDVFASLDNKVTFGKQVYVTGIVMICEHLFSPEVPVQVNTVWTTLANGNMTGCWWFPTHHIHTLLSFSPQELQDLQESSNLLISTNRSWKTFLIWKNSDVCKSKDNVTQPHFFSSAQLGRPKDSNT